VKLADVTNAVQCVAADVPFDPLGDWLRGLPARWDGVERLDSWLTAYCGAEETRLTAMIGAKFLIGAVARALQPGCRMDYMLILEGDQGIGKSTVVQVLGGEYAGENLPDFSSRDAMQIAGAKWFIEVSELAALKRSEVEEVKGFLTRTEDTFVPKYAKHPIAVKRCSVLIGSVNPGATGYLLDPTGNRRFWPVKVWAINLAALRQDREQLFAEAVFRFQRGDPWWVENDDQKRMLTEEQDARVEEDDWEVIIAKWLSDGVAADPGRGWPRSNRLDRTTSAEIATKALGMQPKEINRATQTRIGNIMKRLGYSKRRVCIEGRREWIYETPDKDHAV
jgi:predicted P-loop ATPase